MENKVNSCLEKINTYTYLENIRMLFDFMDELNCRYWQERRKEQHYCGYLGIGGLERRTEILKGITQHIENVISKCLLSKSNKIQFLYQNPLSSYLSFYLKLFPMQTENDKPISVLGQKLTPMLNYFNILQYLTDEKFAQEREYPSHHESLPYVYEDLCLTIREMTGCHACFLLYFEKGETTELVSRSGYVMDINDREEGVLSNFNIKISELDSIVKQYNALTTAESIRYQVSRMGISPSQLTFSTISELIDGIKIIQGVSEPVGSEAATHKYLVFEFPFFTEDYQVKNDRSFYLLLDYRVKSGESLFAKDAKASALKVLFLRRRLWEALRRDYAELIDYRFDCSYIKSIKKAGKPTIMHISDPHLPDDKDWESQGEKSKYLCNHLREEQKGQVDLLAVTGDIVMASHDALNAQTKYHCVGQLIQEMAIALWAHKPDGKNGTQILPHDWKRRIMIVAGNHDYAAMNDVVVETGGRRIKSARPASNSGGTLSKFTYYIEFLVNFLDAPIDELLGNDLNEIRDYKCLGLTVAMINTSSKANSLQNNKVAINVEKVNRLIQQTSWHKDGQDRNYIALMHHVPSYVINYMKDKYEVYKYLKEDEYENYFKQLKKVIGKWPQKVKYDRDSIEKIRTLLDDKQDSDFNKSELKSDMTMLLNIIDCPDIQNEFQHEFVSKSRNLLFIQARDNANFKTACDIILNKGKTIVLGGHEHETLYREYSVHDTTNPVFVICKLYSNFGENKKSFFYLTITPDKTDNFPTATAYSVPLKEGEASIKLLGSCKKQSLSSISTE